MKAKPAQLLQIDWAFLHLQTTLRLHSLQGGVGAKVANPIHLFNCPNEAPQDRVVADSEIVVPTQIQRNLN